MLEDGRHVRRWERQKSHHHRHPHHEQSLMRYQRRRGLRTKCVHEDKVWSHYEVWGHCDHALITSAARW